MMDKIVAATRNKNKVEEIRDILKGMPFEILSLYDLNINADVEEDGSTFEENAYKKAYEIMRLTNLPAIADDSGLEVDALGGAPGVYSARFSGVHGDDEANNKKLLELLKHTPDEKRGAKFVCAIALVYPDGRKILSRGEVKGFIGYEPKGDKGFGYDPLFIVPEYNMSFAQLDSSVKNSISHRGRALEQLKDKLLASL